MVGEDAVVLILELSSDKIHLDWLGIYKRQFSLLQVNWQLEKILIAQVILNAEIHVSASFDL